MCTVLITLPDRLMQGAQRAGLLSRIFYLFAPASRSLAVLILAMMLAFSAAAQSYPSRPIKIVVPFPAGAATDTITRIFAQKLGEVFGQPVIVDNKAGATGAIGSSFVAAAPADGYTLLMATTSTHSVAPNLYKKPPYDPVKDFETVSLVAQGPHLLVVNPAIPVSSVKDLIALAKSRPGKITFASSGNGSSIHIAGELFKSMANVDMLHVPYKGAAPAVNDVISGQVSIMFDTLTQSLPHIQSGRLKALAVTTAQRSSALPNVPTLSEAGLPGFEITTWIGLLAPMGTPKHVIDRIHTEIVKIAKLDDVRAQLGSAGVQLVASTPQEFHRLLSTEVPKFGKVMREAGMEQQ